MPKCRFLCSAIKAFKIKKREVRDIFQSADDFTMTAGQRCVVLCCVVVPV